MTRIAIENSTWNNIGDAFYQTSLVASFNEIAPDADISEFDGPIERSFRVDEKKFGVKPWYDTRFDVDADIYVFSGPLLNKAFIDHYGALIKHILANGRRYALLSTFAKADGSEAGVKEFLLANPPMAFSSRDDSTFDRFSDVSPNSFRGLCSAFYIPHIPGLATVKPEKPYVVSSFYTRPEAKLTYSGGMTDGVPDWSKLKVDAPLWPMWRLSRHAQFLHSAPNEVAGHNIVRAVHDIAYKYHHLNFPIQNRYLTYNAKCLISLYSGTSLVVSDRVHACVAGLAFGKPAILIGKFDRAALLQAHSVTTMQNGVLRADMSKIAAVRQEFHAFLKQNFL